MSGEPRCRREKNSAFSRNVRRVIFVILLSALRISVTLFSARYDQWTHLQLETP